MLSGHFCQFSKCPHFSNISCVLEPFFALNKNGPIFEIFASNNFFVVLDTFFACLWQFNFLTESDNFAKALAFLWWEFVSSFKIVPFVDD